MTGRELENAVIELARLHGWRVHHQRPGLTAGGEWRSAVTGDAGFPDIVCAKGGRVLFIECKAGVGRLSPRQAEWLEAINGTDLIGPPDGHTALVVRPNNLQSGLLRLLR